VAVAGRTKGAERDGERGIGEKEEKEKVVLGKGIYFIGSYPDNNRTRIFTGQSGLPEFDPSNIRRLTRTQKFGFRFGFDT